MRGATAVRFNTILPTLEVRTIGELVLILSDVQEGWRTLAAQMAAAGGRMPPGMVARAGLGIARALDAKSKAGGEQGCGRSKQAQCAEEGDSGPGFGSSTKRCCSGSSKVSTK